MKITEIKVVRVNFPARASKTLAQREAWFVNDEVATRCRVARR
jgi:hypothetical protein